MTEIERVQGLRDALDIRLQALRDGYDGTLRNVLMGNNGERLMALLGGDTLTPEETDQAADYAKYVRDARLLRETYKAALYDPNVMPDAIVWPDLSAPVPPIPATMPQGPPGPPGVDGVGSPGAQGPPGVSSFATGGNIGSATTPATTGAMTVVMDTAIKTITPSGACTFNASGGVAGQITTFVITTSGVISRVLTWVTNFKTVGTLVTGTITARTFCVSFRCTNGTLWVEIGRTATMI